MKYVGSKNRLSKQLAPIIQSYIDGMGEKCNGYWEPFVGGANMIDKIKFSHKYGSDSHKYLIALLRHIQQTTDDIPDTITEDEYYAVRTNPAAYPDWYVGLVGFCTFGGKWWGGYPRSFKADGATPRDMPNEIFRNIKKQAPLLEGISFACRNYADCTADGMVIYCDPPIETRLSKQLAISIMKNFTDGVRIWQRTTSFSSANIGCQMMASSAYGKATSNAR